MLYSCCYVFVTVAGSLAADLELPLWAEDEVARSPFGD